MINLPHFRLVWLGGLAGLIPFYFSALAVQTGWVEVLLFKSYSVIILAFLSGVVWWHGLQQSDRASMVVALVIPALAWLFFLLPLTLMLLLLATAYVLLWGWEMYRLRPFYPASYITLRTLLTVFVLFAHAWVIWI